MLMILKILDVDDVKKIFCYSLKVCQAGLKL